MNQSFYIGAIGAQQQLQRLNVHGDNIANVNTYGFKADRSHFEALMYQNGLRAAEQEIQRETRRLEELPAEEEKKREAVVEAKKDTSSIEKLKEKKLDAYRRAEAKSEETFIEEFVSTMRVNAANA